MKDVFTIYYLRVKKSNIYIELNELTAQKRMVYNTNVSFNNIRGEFR